MSDTIAISGFVATPPHIVTAAGDLKITSFRVASNQRRFDRGRDRWVDGETNWYTVTTFRQLASNVATSVVKGDRVVVTGRLRVREWEAGEKSGTNVEIEADSVGHDLTWGTTSFTRVRSTAAASAEAQSANRAEEFPTEADLAPLVFADATDHDSVPSDLVPSDSVPSDAVPSDSEVPAPF